VYECCVPKTSSPTAYPTFAPTKDGATYIDEYGIPRVPTKSPTHEMCDVSGLTDPSGNACTGDYEPFCTGRPCPIYCDNDRTRKTCEKRPEGSGPAPCPSPINNPDGAPVRWIVKGRVDVDTATLPNAYNFDSWVDSTFEDAIDLTVVDVIGLNLDADRCAKEAHVYKTLVQWYQDKPGYPGVKQVDFSVQLWDEESAKKVQESLKTSGTSGATAFTDVYGLASNLCPPMTSSAYPMLFTTQCASAFRVEQTSVTMAESTEEAAAQEQQSTTAASSSGGAIAAVVILGLLLTVAVGGFMYYRRAQLAATSSREIGWLRSESSASMSGAQNSASSASLVGSTNLQHLDLDRPYA